MAKQTANEAYSEKMLEVKRLMGKLNSHLAAHQNRQQADSRNWGFVGDLETYAKLLKRIVEPEQ